MDIGWINDAAWIGTSVVAVAGLAATVWTGRRAGQIQLTVQEKQLTESRRVLEWQERRTVYAVFLQQFQESFDLITTQHQINWASTESGLSFFIESNSEVAAKWEAARESGARERIAAVIRKELNEEVGLLSLRETWAWDTKIADAANQVRLISPRAVGQAVDDLMAVSARSELESAAKDGWEGIESFKDRVQEQQRMLDRLMNADLTKV